MQISTIEQLHQIAEDRGGRCVSEEYKNSTSKLLWECEKGHQWEALPGNVKRGTWCPDCSGKRKRSIEDMYQIASEHDGRCLSDTYKNAHAKLLWECSQGHQWEASSVSVRLVGRWCPICTRTTKRFSNRTIEDMQNVAAKRGGQCLSNVYKGALTRLLWECSKGHHWEATPGHIINGRWCPKCAGNAKYTIEDMQNVAAERGGRCLSDTYTNNSTKLIWECSEGHQWVAMPMKIINGTWCRKCSRTNKQAGSE